MLDSSGGFSIGGKVLTDPVYLNQTLSCDHGYVEYFIPWKPRTTSLVMWHSSSTQSFQNRWDGGEGYKDIFLRRDYPVYLWEGPYIGRANWGCKPYNYTPAYRDQGNFAAWNLGLNYPDYWPDVQYPDHDRAYYWDQATRARYVEFDNFENLALHSDVAALAADSGKLGNNIVYLTNSAAGIRGLMTAIKSNSTNIKGLVMYEDVGCVFPDTAGIPASDNDNGFGPFVIPEAEFKKLARLKTIQFVWGDHRSPAEEAKRYGNDWTQYVECTKNMSRLINEYGGNSEVFWLSEQGLKGSTHIAFMDQDNQKVADLLSDLLKKHGLDGYASS